MDALKAMWTVKAGIVPGFELPEYGRRWVLTSRDFDGKSDRERGEIYSRKADEAMEYARDLQDPRRFNWVTLEFLRL